MRTLFCPFGHVNEQHLANNGQQDNKLRSREQTQEPEGRIEEHSQ